MQVALLGAGRIGVMHAALLVELLDPESLLVADIDAARATEVATRTGARAAAVEDAIAAADARRKPRDSVRGHVSRSA